MLMVVPLHGNDDNPLCKYGKLCSSYLYLMLKIQLEFHFSSLRLRSLLDVSIHRWNNPLILQQSFTLQFEENIAHFLRVG